MHAYVFLLWILLHKRVKIFWWDTRKISEPTEEMCLDPTKKQDITKAHAAISLEYEPTIVSLVSLVYEFAVNFTFTMK